MKRKTKKQSFLRFCIVVSTLNISRAVTLKRINHNHSLKKFSGAFKYFAQTLLFAVISSKYKKWAIFDILMTIILAVNMITRKMTPLFINSLSCMGWHISFLHFKTFKIHFHGAPLCIICFHFKIHIVNCQRWHFQACQRRYPFSTYNLLTFASYIIQFWYMICFVPYLTPIRPRSSYKELFLDKMFIDCDVNYRPLLKLNSL